MSPSVLLLVFALQGGLSTPAPVVPEVKVHPVPVEQTGESLVYLAAINVGSLVLLAIVARWADARKDRQTAKATADAAVLAAEIKAKEKKLDWDRQDAVALRVAETAKAAADVAAEAIRRQDVVASQVQAAALQTAEAAKLLVNQQSETRTRQDAVADRVQKAAMQAAEAAKLLASAQEQMALATKEVARVAAETQNRVQAQLVAITEQGRKIHILVNSDMTAARTAERDSLKLLVISLKNALALGKKLGVELHGDEEEEIAKVQKRIESLDQILADRLAAQQQIDNEAHARRVGDIHPALPEETSAAAALVVDSLRLAALQEIAHSTAETARNTAKHEIPD